MSYHRRRRREGGGKSGAKALGQGRAGRPAVYPLWVVKFSL